MVKGLPGKRTPSPRHLHHREERGPMGGAEEGRGVQRLDPEGAERARGPGALMLPRHYGQRVPASLTLQGPGLTGLRETPKTDA